ncbi:MAG TPA: TGS domain-containing protein, partial [Bacteroidetes bacterium]|nr:TGS domain-containing protein [Bacteroidota bacterium]
MINIKFPDGTIKKFEKGITPLQIAQGISEGLARNVLSAGVNGKVQDATIPLEEDADLVLYTWKDKEGKATYWHSSAHLMAEALEELYPGIKFGIGPDIENGFYYDVDFGDYEFTKDDLKKVEKKMIELAKQKQSYTRTEVSKKDALDYFTKKGDEYKIELIQDLEDGEITFYKTGNFTDLCRGPHLPDTKPIKAVKLLNIAGAYWRGDENRKMMTRIYGITFPQKKELKEYLDMLE